MITVEQTRDFETVRLIFTDPAVYALAAQDGAPVPENFRPCEHEGIYYVLIRLDGAPAGVWMLVPHSPICYEIHTALLPILRGRDAIVAAHIGREWLWNSTPCLRLITNVPAYNRRAVMFSRMVGMKEFGRNEKAFMKDGKLHDLLMFGLSKPGVS